MLADDIVTDTVYHALYDGMDKTVEKIRRAQKFILTADFAVAADGLVENIPQLEKVIPICRLPFPLTWVEFLHDERPHWNSEGPFKARPVDPARHQGAPQRVGFLLERLEEKTWEAHLFWKLRSLPSGSIENTLLNGSLMSMQFDCNATSLIGATTPQPSRFGLGFMENLLRKAPAIYGRLLEYGLEDWGGETRFLIATLGLLNARNVVVTEKVDKEPENIRRERKGKRTLFSHTLIKVRPFVVAGGGTVTGGGHVELRMHFVRGHFKNRRTGMFWWSDHARGRMEHGQVEKDYEVER